MRSRKERNQSRLQLEALEARIALSGIGGADDGARHHVGQVEVQMLRPGADDPAGHRARDDRGLHLVRLAPHRQGVDDPAGHNARDAQGGGRRDNGTWEPKPILTGR